MHRVKTIKVWQKHQPKKSRRVRRSYYTQDRRALYKKIVKIVWILIVILLIQSIFQIKYLAVDNIKLVNNKDLSLEEIQDTIKDDLTASRWLIFKSNNFFLVPSKEIAAKLQNKYNLDDISIKKEWPDTLLIRVTEKISHFIWSADDSLYLLDAKGALIRQISSLDARYIILDDKRTQHPLSGQIFNDAEVELINNIYLSWQSIIGSKALINKILIDDDQNILELHTKIGFFVKMDPREDINNQLNNLNQVLTADNVSGLDIDYIDIRFPDRAYFK